METMTGGRFTSATELTMHTTCQLEMLYFFGGRTQVGAEERESHWTSVREELTFRHSLMWKAIKRFTTVYEQCGSTRTQTQSVTITVCNMPLLTFI